MRISSIGENDYFGSPKIKWLQLSGEVGIFKAFDVNFLRISHG